MKIDFIAEPELEFGGGRHIDIRFGLMNYGPFDIANITAPREIRVGYVGTSGTIDGVLGWFERCSQGIAAKQSKQPNLFPAFPGFGSTSTFRTALVTSSNLQREIRQRTITDLSKHGNPERLITEAVELFMTELTYLTENYTVDVVLCAIPMDLLEMLRPDETQHPGDAQEPNPEGEGPFIRLDFRHMLKAEAMRLRKPIQLILPPTYDITKKLKSKTKDTTRVLQDEATRAWNCFTALYYKAGGTPWRLVRDHSELSTCYVGIGFFKSLDGMRLLTSMAQVFNERGDGIIVRGGAAKQSKHDKHPYLEDEDAYNLLGAALTKYRSEHHTVPARVVLHKSSPFRQQEIDGFGRAVEDHRIEVADFVSMRKGYTRLFRIGNYPPMRGTFMSLDEESHVLYSRGSVDFFKTYPGMYVPSPLQFHCDKTDQAPHFLAREILGLTKMNWNDTQFDGSYPITLEAANHVGDVLKYLSDSAVVEPRYSFYM